VPLISTLPCVLEKAQQRVSFPIIEVGNGDLSTAQLAERTGVPAGTLRMWESRHGFPAPERLPGGHRRYHDRDVEHVRAVARLREHGLSMAAAIAQVLRAEQPLASSVFSGLRERHAEVQPAVLSKRAVLSLTQAIEDEYCARASRGLLVGSFQAERFYRQAERRWRELDRTTELTVALADFTALREPTDAPAEVPIPGDQPVAREWTLVIDAPAAQACLAAWEQPSQRQLPDPERRFEVLWSFEPAVVRSASEVAIDVLRSAAPVVAKRADAVLSHPVAPPDPELRFASALTHRMVSYLVDRARGAGSGSPSRSRES
jgi:DICT domain-containing protein